VHEPYIEKPVTGDYYRHNNTGRVYLVLHLARIEATKDEVVVYRSQEKDWEQPWVRPVSEFFEVVDMDDGEHRERFTHHKTGAESG
jgi:hypothetical protein